MARIEDLYTKLLDYIERDSIYKIERAKEHAYIVSKLESIESQAKLTNGRVTKLEADIVILKGNDHDEVIIKKVNWKWVMTLASAIWFIFSTALYVLIDYLKAKFL